MTHPRASDQTSSRRQILLGILTIFVWLAATSWLRHFTAPDEGRYVGVALEMLRTGDWLVPRLDGMPFFHKPPLFYWLGAGAMKIFGLSEWAARLPSMLGATAAAASLWLFLARWKSAPFAMVAVLTLVTMPFLYIGAQFANLDMLVAGCIALTVLLAAHAALASEVGEPWRTPLAFAFASAAMGILSKGLIGLVLPGIVFVGWALATRNFRRLRLLLWWPGWLVLLCIALPWFIYMQIRFAEFFDYFVITQHFRRFAGSGFNNAQPFWFYLPVVCLLTAPWAGWLLVSPRKQWRVGLSDVDCLMLVWLAVIVGFFSLPQSKLIGYVLPALPPIAHFVARAVERLRPKGALYWQPLRWTLGLAAAVCVLSVVAADRFGTPPAARLKLPVGVKIAKHDQVVMLDAYYYELPFYWRLPHRVKILSDWKNPNIPLIDNWRKEMADAARFDAARGNDVLVAPEDIKALLCTSQTTWFIGSQSAVGSWPWLADVNLDQITQYRDLVVWKFAGTAKSSFACLNSYNVEKTAKPINDQFQARDEDLQPVSNKKD